MNTVRFTIIALLFSFISVAQKTANTSKSEEKKAIIQVIDDFFTSLHTQDTVLYKSTLLDVGQIWVVNNSTEKRELFMRFFKDDTDTFDPEVIFKEIPLSYDISVHNGIALAWVPYEFYINGEFSHCGIDIFTLAEIKENWKILNASYTKDIEGCNPLKQ